MILLCPGKRSVVERICYIGQKLSDSVTLFVLSRSACKALGTAGENRICFGVAEDGDQFDKGCLDGTEGRGTCYNYIDYYV